MGPPAVLSCHRLGPPTIHISSLSPGWGGGEHGGGKGGGVGCLQELHLKVNLGLLLMLFQEVSHGMQALENMAQCNDGSFMHKRMLDPWS